MNHDALDSPALPPEVGTLWVYDANGQSGPVPPLYADTLGRWGLAAYDAARALPPTSRGLRWYGHWYVALAVPRVDRPSGIGRPVDARWQAEWAPALAAWLPPWAAWVVAGRTGPELAQLLQQADDEGPRLLRVAEEIRLAATGTLRAFHERYGPWLTDPRDKCLATFPSPLLTVADKPANHETTRALWQLKEAVEAAGKDTAWLREAILDASPGNLHDTRAANPAGTVWLAQWDRFLDHHGRRCDEAGGMGPSWIEDPSVPLRLLQAYLDDTRRRPSDHWDGVQAARDAEEAAVLGRLPPGTSFLLDVARARQAHELASHRVDDIVQQVAYRLRRIVAAVGDWLVEDGQLAQRGDVLFLTRAECLAALESRAAAPPPLHQLVRQRQAQPDRAAPGTPPPVLGHGVQAPPDSADASWQGTAGAPGRVRGPVRVVQTLRDAAAARPGEIAVARLVTSQWAPGLPLVAGLVAEGGGPYAPGVLAAAEFGVPAVVGVPDATRHLHSGDWIEVDGRSGQVRRLDA